MKRALKESSERQKYSLNRVRSISALMFRILGVFLKVYEAMKRVFIFSRRSLFSYAIKILLDAENTVEVVGWETDMDKALVGIEAQQPDVILIVAKSMADSPIPRGQCFFRTSRTAKVIELYSEDSSVNVYYGEQIVIGDVQDLVRTIEEPMTTSFPQHGTD